MSESSVSEEVKAAEELIEANLYQEALDSLSHYTDKSDVYYLMLLGFCHYKLANYVAAIPWFDRALEGDERATNTLYLRAVCKLEIDDYYGARSDFEKVLVIQPRTYDAFVGIGVIDECESKVQEAIHNYQRALDISSQSTVARKRLRALTHN